MTRFLYRHRVRYRECDPMGVVYHAHVLDWFEAARTEALRAAGLPYRQLEEDGVVMPVVEVAVRYHASVRYDDLVEVEAAFPSVGARVPVEYGRPARGRGGGAHLRPRHALLSWTPRAAGPSRRPRPSGRRWPRRELAVGCWLLAVGCWLLAVGCWLLKVPGWR